MDKTEQLEKLKQHPARLEVLLGELAESKRLSLDAVMIRSRSLFKRAYSNDVLDYEVIPSNQNKKNAPEIVMIDVSREGFYDALPEFFFHTPEVTSGYKAIEQRLQESERVREEADAARRFFLPFEQEFFRQRIAIELQERKLLSGFSNPMQRVLFERFWTDVQEIDQQSESILFYLLPLAYKIAGNRALMTACFEAVLREPVRLQDVHAGLAPLDDAAIPGLGNCSLGVDMMLGGKLEEDLPNLNVFVGPLHLDAVPDYLEGGRKSHLIDLLYNYFVPAEMEVKTHILMQQPEEGFVLSSENATARLGYSTYI